ncbi:hypothetical protein NPA31_013315 [Aurantimonas sp. MSK8Z-1]|uniref:hypothetical protein n=1 Tax=Mangrovibrevibacter kandeliae TaxID=2968473 RepID=UPI0021176880|nr:hypothetical protein [Aurantimonas sp. MSK8Z-1]MCW4115939.1 hypothetical protein [Aurantimonas sp. MSK8Z-1]
MISEAAVQIPTSMRKATRSMPASFDDQDLPTAGMLVGRPELDDEAVLAALADRLAFDRRNPADAQAVLRLARAGNGAARAMLRRLVLPAPKSRLAMPQQVVRRDAEPRAVPAVRFALRRG